jgi:hypothetical protein
VFDGVDVIRAHFFEELLEVVLGRSCLALAVTRGLYSMFHDGAICLLIAAAAIVDCGLLAALVAPLLASLGALLGTLDGNTNRRFPTATQGWLKSCRPGAGGVMGGDATPSISGALGGVGRHVDRLRKCFTKCAASSHPCQCPPGVTTEPPPSTELIIVRVPS